MLAIMVVLIPKSKVVHDEAKSDVVPHVLPHTRCVLTLIVAFDGKAFFE
jgi:hypothetical protein